jgi:hypothetical protein
MRTGGTQVFAGGWNETYHAERGKKPTRREEIFAFICMYADEHNGPTPSILEIKGHFGLAYGTVYAHVMKLIAERRLEQQDGKLVVPGSEWVPPPAC